ncbi:uncharacterized protein LOC135218723 [Macrobrachium nipponense]|uniref:uncharacterized protein LOC135218723 n=1 Tax=Macrobrachium nipponense TaxID=159736 RepID=UPI0030C8C749
MASNKQEAIIPLVHQNLSKNQNAFGSTAGTQSDGRFQEVELSMDTVDFVNPETDSDNKDWFLLHGPDIMLLRSITIGEMIGGSCNVNDDNGNRIFQVTTIENNMCCNLNFRDKPRVTIDITNAFNEICIQKYDRPIRTQKFQLTMCEVLEKPARRIGSIDGVASDGIFLKTRSKETFLIYMDEKMGKKDYQQAYKIYPTLAPYDVGTIRYNKKKEFVLTFPLKCASYERYLIMACAVLLCYQLQKMRRDVNRYFQSTKPKDAGGGDVGGGDVDEVGGGLGGVFGGVMRINVALKRLFSWETPPCQARGSCPARKQSSGSTSLRESPGGTARLKSSPLGFAFPSNLKAPYHARLID